MGFVILGVFAFNQLAYQGVVMQMITHGISTGALFIMAGIIKDRIHTRDINQMGGFWDNVPVMGAAAMIFAMASLGLPGLGNFIAEFLTLMGTWQANPWMTGLATLGLVGATIYSLRIIQRVFYGPRDQRYNFPDLNWREIFIMGSLTIAIVWLGLYPQPVINIVDPFVRGLQQIIMIH
jgi:NADH-quinone oxidoreductase subunit M